MFGEVLEIELALAHLLGDALRLFGVDGLGGLLDEGDDVAHAEDAIGDARGIEIVQRVHLLADADQLDRLAGDGAHRQRRAATAVAVDAGQHDACDADALVEIAREIDGVLAGQGVGHQQDFMRAGGGLDLRHLDHQRLVDMRAAGGVEHDDVVALQASDLFGADGDLNRRLARHDRQRVDADLAAEHGELFLRRRTLDVERGHQHALLLAFRQALGDLCGGGGLTGALQADHHDGDRGGRVEVDGLGLGAQRLGQDVRDDLDDHLAGRDRLDDIGADGALARLVGKAAHDFQRDVGLQQRAAHFAQSRFHIRLAQRAAARELVEYAGKLFAEAFEHLSLQTRRGTNANRARGRFALPGGGLLPRGRVG